MNRTKNNSVFLFLFVTLYLFSINKIEAQQQDTIVAQEPQIVVLSRPTKQNSIMLRWAATTPRAWRKLNIHGYQVKRFTVTRDNKTLKQPIEKNIGVFKPKPLEEWMPIIESNDNAAIMAQSLYGDSFNLQGQDQLSAIVNLSEEQSQRFTWGLYVADQDFETAKLAGLGYIDTDVKSNEKYIYKITSLVPESELLINEGGVFTGLQDYVDLPKPLDLAGVFDEGTAMLSWNWAIHKERYNSYFIERSEDGSTFNRLNKLPLTSLSNHDKTGAKRMFYIDSISNGMKYHYRILGRTPFGELGPVSDVVSGTAEAKLAFTPKITNKYYYGDQGIELEWEFPNEGNKDIKGFELNRSDKADGQYKTVIKNISPESRKIKYDSLMPSNYMTISAITKNGTNKKTSFPVLVQPVDSFPPVKPVGFKGSVDSLGIVTLKWNANKEEDMLGYRVFRGNNKNEEYSQITVSPHRGTVYYDSISVKNLNSKVFYTLIAVDKRFNMSEASEILELKKPDFIKPTQPVFKSYKIIEGQVNMTWANSSSKDVVRHEVYRKGEDDTDWQLVHSIPSTSTKPKKNKSILQEQWFDKNTENGKQYTYTIIAVDSSDLESTPAPPLNVQIPKAKASDIATIKGLGGYADKKNGFIEIYWKEYKEKNVAEIAIYKGLKDEPISLFRNVGPSVKRVVDNKLKPNNNYIYMVRAVFKDGSMSEVAKLDVKY